MNLGIAVGNFDSVGIVKEEGEYRRAARARNGQKTIKNQNVVTLERGPTKSEKERLGQSELESLGEKRFWFVVTD